MVNYSDCSSSHCNPFEERHLFSDLTFVTNEIMGSLDTKLATDKKETTKSKSFMSL